MHQIDRPYRLGRREFLGQLTVGAGGLATGWIASGGSGAHAAAQEAANRETPTPSPEKGIPSLEKTPIVDTHLHLWDLKKLRVPWLRQGDPLCRDHLMDEYLREAQGLNIVQTVYMEVDAHDEDLLKEAEYVLALAQQKDSLMTGVVLGGRPGTEPFASYIRRFQGSPWVKGVRRIPRGGDTRGWKEKAFIEDIRLLGRLGMSFDICTPPQRLPDAIKLVDACPETRFVLDHCGNADPAAFARPKEGQPQGEGKSKEAGAPRAPAHDPDQWRRDLAELARRDRVVCKISGIIAQADKQRWKPEDLAPIVKHCLEVFGPDRVIFASDWPVCTRVASLRQWVLALKEIVWDRSAVDNVKLFYQNAVNFYGLPRRSS